VRQVYDFTTVALWQHVLIAALQRKMEAVMDEIKARPFAWNESLVLKPSRPEQPAQDLTWKELAKLEPRLKKLLKEARAVKDPGGEAFCANAVWYGYGRYSGNGFKERMNRLAGFYAESDNKRLKTMEAHGLVYDKLYSALPNCRKCLCF
jgi:hypothetical protein